MRPVLVVAAVFALWPALAPGPGNAQTALPNPPIESENDPGWMSGQPPRWRLGIGPLAGYDYLHERVEGRLFADAEGRLAAPQFGLLDLNLEGALDFNEGGVGSAAGLYMKIPYVRVGVEQDFDEPRTDFVLSLQGSLRRGGMFHRGERLRLDWLPARSMIRGGFSFNTPWMHYRATRPYRTHFDLPKGSLP